MRNIIDSIIRVLCTAIMGIMVVAVCWQVITRYVLNNPSTVTEEAFAIFWSGPPWWEQPMLTERGSTCLSIYF